jgi:hypothetical protein
MLQVDALHHSTGLGQQHHLELLAPHAGRNIILSFVMSPVWRIRIPDLFQKGEETVCLLHFCQNAE